MTLIINVGVFLAMVVIMVGAALILVGLHRLLGMLNVDEPDNRHIAEEGWKSVRIQMPDWMLEDLRARAGRHGVSVVELIRRDVSASRILESQGLDPWGQPADENPERP